MEYTWKHGITGTSDHTFKTEHYLKAKQILVDLCTGDKYQVLSVEKPRDRTRFPVLQTWPAGKCTGDEIAYFRKETGYVLAENCTPFIDITCSEWRKAK